MKLLTVFIVSLTLFFQSSSKGIRESFEQASGSIEQAEVFYEKTLSLDDTDLSTAYKGAALITKGKYAKGIKNKKMLIVEGAGLLDQAVNNKPTNLEIRLVRLIIQEHLPNIVKYKSNLQEDKEAIVKGYNSQSTELKKWISDYARQSKIFTAEDKSKLL
ncbi:hypothetical protein [Myroides pelagicus]|uniref:Uncharacterized protein n=1 Tax=Myroides pelagicus TaxID=270914 RepID=A0A7K1GKR0_9FLAO|nr:hypothetical protein [Myroides pelagicus]MEC4113274.1 hypothetical protein [Myroides pelagicus]MTH29441.1 hypothetical protein [Myroides pelagicus]